MPVAESSFLRGGFLFGEETVDVSSSMQDADNVDAVSLRQVEDEVLFKSAHRKPAQAFQSRNFGIVERPALRMLHQLKASLVDGVKYRSASSTSACSPK